jgi:hypothetical protein
MIYKHTQHVPLPILGVAAAIGATVAVLTPGRIAKPAMIALVAGSTLTMRSLTVTVDDSMIEIQFGSWLTVKRILLFDVLECVITRTSPWSGWGVHYTGEAWLYNVYGLDAVELILRGGGMVVIGTDEPSELAAAIRALTVNAAENKVP